jgi:hypothetical protein
MIDDLKIEIYADGADIQSFLNLNYMVRFTSVSSNASITSPTLISL